MVKTIVALLMLLLAMVGPAAAQESDPQSEPEAAPEGSAPPPDDSRPSEETPSEEPAPSGPVQTARGATACRVVVTHIADPTMSPNRWIIPDPDGCVQRTIERLIGPTGQAILRRML